MSSRNRSVSSAVLLSQRALNRALLARQMLVQRERITTLTAIEKLAGMQAQAPQAPYVGLWTRIADFGPVELVTLLEERQVVRAPLMRATIHLVTRADCLAMRPSMQAVLERSFGGTAYARNLAGIDREAFLATARTLLEAQPRTRLEVGQALQAAWPDRDVPSMACAVSALLPAVQVPPRGLWRKSGQPVWTTIEAWLGQSLDPKPSLERLVRRYLAAFGPATIADMQAWSGLTRLAEAFEPLRPQLLLFRDAQGQELFDLPDAPRPDPDTPAPPRFLPEYDNLLLSHADRTRVIAEAYRSRVFTRGAALLDGFVCGSWQPFRKPDGCTLFIEPFRPLDQHEEEELRTEGARLLAFLFPGQEGDIEFGPMLPQPPVA